MERLNVDNTFVVHVSKGAEDREKYITKHLADQGIDFEFMLKGDLNEITPEIHAKYFKGHMLDDLYPAVSCALKHIYILEEIVKRDLNRALILEDDIVLDNKFIEICNKAMEELDAKNTTDSYFISLENNRNYISKSEEIPGHYLYKKDASRYAGAYIISGKAAKNSVDEILNNKCHRHIDWYYNSLAEKGKFTIYWIHPTIAEQGSHNGKFSSLLDNKPSGFFRKISWRVQTLMKTHIHRKLK